MALRATRRALIVASVPDETKRRSSTHGYARLTRTARSVSDGVGAPYDVPRAAASCTASTTAGCAWPRIIGPHDAT